MAPVGVDTTATPRRRGHHPDRPDLAQTATSADAAGYRALLDFAPAQIPGRRCWAVEGPAATALD